MWMLDRFVEAKEKLEQVTTRILQQWALACSVQFQSNTFKFTASNSWITSFKRQHKIRQKKIIKYVSEREVSSMERTLAAAHRFQKHIRTLISNYNPDFVINTDQTGCQSVHY